ncbi:tyrosine-tRNA ligase [Naematelia encephala]|uniref:Tyrosine--tRNA ligase n=1 Tax=Naematelia encephala TaxID=71784 RepID=A0A1Y2B679_9TREE|nr:tyrosine-tRNA ligase [Naematelia encephala]
MPLRASQLGHRSWRRALRQRAVTRRLNYSRNPFDLGDTRLLDELKDRGLVAAITHPELRIHLKKPSCVYSGVDPSASSLHVGNLLPLITLLHFQSYGHKALALIGGATGSIGDPSGRSTERPPLSPSQLQENVAGISAQVHRFFSRGNEYISERKFGKQRATDPGTLEVLNNYDWFKNMGFLEFLRVVGKTARVSVMLARDSVKSRMSTDQGISFTEFSYQLLQAYDFSILYRDHRCRVQVGGSDQWGNIVAGIEMIKRLQSDSGEGTEAAKGADGAFGLTIPLLTTSTGEKFGKSAGNAVWLDETRTPVSEFYQFFFRTADEDVERYLKLFTFLPFDVIAKHMKKHDSNTKSRWAQYILAQEVTELVHGRVALKRAQGSQDILYRRAPRDIKSTEVLDAFDGDHRLVRVSWKDIKGLPVTKIGTMFGLWKSRGEATKAVSKQRSVMITDRKIDDPRDEMIRGDLVDEHIAIIRWGVKHVLILYVDDAYPEESES